MTTGRAVSPQKQASAPAAPRIWVPMNTARLTLRGAWHELRQRISGQELLVVEPAALLHDLPPGPGGEPATEAHHADADEAGEQRRQGWREVGMLVEIQADLSMSDGPRRSTVTAMWHSKPGLSVV